MFTGSFLDYIQRCQEDCNCRGVLFSSNDGKVLVKKLAEMLDSENETLVLWYDNIQKIPDTEVNGATFYKIIDGVITNETVTLAEFLELTNWGSSSYMIVGLSGDNVHYWASVVCGSISWYANKNKYAFESNAGFVELLEEQFPLLITDGRG